MIGVDRGLPGIAGARALRCGSAYVRGRPSAGPWTEKSLVLPDPHEEGGGTTLMGCERARWMVGALFWDRPMSWKSARPAADIASLAGEESKG